MSDRLVEKFKQAGRLYLWRYLEGARNFPGWHLSADETAAHNLAALVDLMAAAPFSSEKLLVVTAPTPAVLRVPNNRGGRARWEAPSALLLACPKGKVAHDYLSLSAGGGRAKLEGGRQGLLVLKECVLNLLHGKNDYAIQAGDERLWFW